jgi:hypothetical protein
MLGPDREFELEWVSVYTFQCRRMQKFRHGRVLFVGDAAHQVSPFGARGANSGIQDTDNLVWKLKLVMEGLAPESLLDSYSEERVAAADENLLNSTRSTDFITPKSQVSKDFRNAVLGLAREHAFARTLVNSGRLSVPAHLTGILVAQHHGPRSLRRRDGTRRAADRRAHCGIGASQAGCCSTWATASCCCCSWPVWKASARPPASALATLAAARIPVRTLLVTDREGNGAGGLHAGGGPRSPDQPAPGRPPRHGLPAAAGPARLRTLAPAGRWFRCKMRWLAPPATREGQRPMEELITQANFGIPGQTPLHAFTPGDDFYELLIATHQALTTNRAAWSMRGWCCCWPTMWVTCACCARRWQRPAPEWGLRKAGRHARPGCCAAGWLRPTSRTPTSRSRTCPLAASGAPAPKTHLAAGRGHRRPDPGSAPGGRAMPLGRWRLPLLEPLAAGDLHGFMALGAPAWKAVRAALSGAWPKAASRALSGDVPAAAGRGADAAALPHRRLHRFLHQHPPRHHGGPAVPARQPACCPTTSGCPSAITAAVRPSASVARPAPASGPDQAGPCRSAGIGSQPAAGL